ncbi:Uncharacterized protein OBRU01_05211 [Operophtera brumata]|uniref:C2H2-type domain-containing protein n=1 Tax=Operophtera brumata TaxID=104452 RepID=A0A0L7LMU1_OPEBR|nr:Uncharacterized protein OBRU01_05211 [Operophtera brumata]
MKDTQDTRWKSGITFNNPDPEDGLPRLICKECTKQLKRTYAFNLLCEDSNKTLHKYLQAPPKVHVTTNGGKCLKNENTVKNEDNFKNESVDFEVGEHNVLEILDQNVVEDIKGDIKIETITGSDRQVCAGLQNRVFTDLRGNFPCAGILRRVAGAVELPWRGETAPVPGSKCPHQCDVCGKVLSTKSNLKAHKVCHTDLRPFSCADCPATFRDYHCECGKTFYTSSALKQHKVVHTGEKKYQCKICDRKFTQTSHLSRHFKRDHAKPNMPLPSSEHYRVVLQDGKSFGLIENAIGIISTGVKCEESIA